MLLSLPFLLLSLSLSLSHFLLKFYKKIIPLKLLSLVYRVYSREQLFELHRYLSIRLSFSLPLVIYFYTSIFHNLLGSQMLVAAFSLRQNLRQLMKVSKPSIVGPHIIPCLHGIRCLTIIWIIWGHDYMFLLLAPNVNSYEVAEWAQTPFSMILQSGTIAVDTFFLLSGLLLVMSTLRELER